MAARGGPPLDERAYYRPEIIAWWVNEMGGQPMDENMIHRYLTESPFFDYTTKNGLIFTQARTNHAADQLVRHRRDFEDQLSKQNGTEFMIVGEPQQVTGAPEGVKNGMYVLRKQDRKRSRLPDGSIDEALTTLGTYYVVGEQMYQARAVGDIVGNRLLAASVSLSKFFDEAASLPTFSTTTGYSYIPSQQQAAAKEGVNTGSAAASPPRSRDGSVAPGAADLNSTRGAPAGFQEGSTNGIAAAANPVGARDARLLAQTMTMIDSFGDEFMDENPLVGEPGHFNFTSSTATIKKRRAEEEAAATAEKLKQQQQPPLPPPLAFTTADSTDVRAEKAPSPPAVMTEAKLVKEREKGRRGSRPGDKIKRKKSRPNAQSPTTPGSIAGALTTGAG